MTCKKISPCENCPWRKDASTDTIPGFSPSMMKELLVQCSDDGMAIMACHKSTCDNNIICAGFALIVGYESIGLRIASRTRNFDPKDYSADGVELHDSFEEMMLANGVQPPKRNQVKA